MNLGARGSQVRSPLTARTISESKHAFSGMTLDKCILLQFGTLTGCPLCRESHPLCRLRNPTVISIWVPVGFHPAAWSVQCTPADNAQSEHQRKKAKKAERIDPSWSPELAIAAR